MLYSTWLQRQDQAACHPLAHSSPLRVFGESRYMEPSDVCFNGRRAPLPLSFRSSRTLKLQPELPPFWQHQLQGFHAPLQSHFIWIHFSCCHLKKTQKLPDTNGPPLHTTAKYLLAQLG